MENRIKKAREDEVIKLDGEGNWFHGEFPILHDRTIQFLYKNIERDDQGFYYLTGEDKPVYFKVEEVPFWVVKIERTIAGYLITLTDGGMELLQPDSMWVGKNDALYCVVKGDIPAKFSRAAYNDITRDLQKEGAKYILALGKKRHPLATKAPDGIVLGSKDLKHAGAKKPERDLKAYYQEKITSESEASSKKAKGSEKKKKQKQKVEKKAKKVKAAKKQLKKPAKKPQKKAAKKKLKK
ncbi:DUF1285 domain-containing protein [bacterium]|nr:DUF1285 domain-containing protein [bacterium]